MRAAFTAELHCFAFDVDTRSSFCQFVACTDLGIDVKAIKDFSVELLMLQSHWSGSV